MKLKGWASVTTLALLGAGQTACQQRSTAQAGPTDPAGGPPAALTANEAVEIGVAAYIFAYPLVTMHATKAVATNVEHPKAEKAPVGQFANLRKYPTSSFRTVVAPNADTLYSAAWVDLSDGPYMLSYPDMGKRYFMFPMLDAYTNVIKTPGARDNGGAPATYVITGPSWKGGKLPQGANEVKSPTNTVWIIGRTYCDGTPEDYKAVHDLQDQYKLYPASAYGQKYTPPPGRVDPKVNEKQSVRDQVEAMTADQFFNAAAKAMAVDPPSRFDGSMVARMAKIGLVPGQPFSSANMSPDVAAAFQSVPTTGQERIKAQLKDGGAAMQNGWMVITKTGDYGMNYIQRAFVASVGLGANTPQQAVYPVADADAAGSPLNGAAKYIIHFNRGMTPPVKAFWSVTMYDKQMFFVPNALNRYNISQRNDLKHNADGSFDVYIQNQKPPSADQASNWLPAPKGDFVLMLRMYWPTDQPPSILDGSWQPPPVTMQSEAPRMGHPAPKKPHASSDAE
jgi:hypothetical protein